MSENHTASTVIEAQLHHRNPATTGAGKYHAAPEQQVALQDRNIFRPLHLPTYCMSVFVNVFQIIMSRNHWSRFVQGLNIVLERVHQT